ncbi:hypothetical protein HPB51_017355 [Rhipicephalus microplus]|uniref:Acyltransferase 3 domain-containing protein n=1 Tax=Rhipicephalus microplus TaxID=6941 RepID=A0A9J6EHI6_RHIMP|nr:hypothetical protein HPB51_017355 [Rhipicephalus microplus]
MVQSLVDMSILRATQKLLTVKTPDDHHNRNLQAVHGIRTFNVFWIVVGHTYAFAEQTTYRSGNNILSMASNVLFQPVINSFLCVDSFFFLRQVLRGPRCLLLLHHTPLSSHAATLLNRKPLVQQRRSLFDGGSRSIRRLVPVAAVCMTVLFLLPELASGPIWSEKVARAIGNCHRSWWSVLLNSHNFYSYAESCQPHYWYISADLQIFPVVLATSILMGRNLKLGVIISASVLVVSVVVVGALTYVNGYPPAILLLGKDVLYSKELLSEIYFRPYVHIGPYIMGSLVACLYLNRRNVRITPFLEVIGWLASVAAGCYVNLVTVAWEDGRYPSPLWSSAYAALHRVVWAACLGWVVYACAIGRGGILNTILSWKPLVPVSRISFTIYVVHIYVIYLKLWTIRERLSPDHFHVPFNEPVCDDPREETVLRSGPTLQQPAAPATMAMASDLATTGTEASALPAGVFAKPQGDSTDLASQTASLLRDAVYVPLDFASGTISGATWVPSPEDRPNSSPVAASELCTVLQTIDTSSQRLADATVAFSAACARTTLPPPYMEKNPDFTGVDRDPTAWLDEIHLLARGHAWTDDGTLSLAVSRLHESAKA